MFTTEIICTSSDGSKTSLDLNQEIPISLNFNIADIRTPDKRDGSYSKTIKVYGTKKNNSFFEHAYSVNVKSYRFNPNVRTPVVVFDDGLSVLQGFLQLKNIEKIVKNNTESIVYECAIFGYNTDLFFIVGDSLLENLDLSRWDHTFDLFTQDLANIGRCYDNGVLTPGFLSDGEGYRYPLIDYGDNGFASNYWKADWIRPALFAKEYWDAIFAAAGKTYTSSFLNDYSKPFKHLIIPHNGDALSISAASKVNLECKVGVSVNGPATNNPFTYAGGNLWKNNQPTTATVVPGNSLNCVWNDDTTLPFSDPGGVYNTSTGVFVIGGAGNYNFNGLLSFEVKLNYPATAINPVNLFGTNNYIFKLLKSTNAGATWTILQSANGNNTQVLTNIYQQQQFNLGFTPFYAVAGEYYMIAVQMTATGYGFTDAGSNFVNTGSASFDCRINTNSTMNLIRTDSNIVEGNTLLFNDAIPKGVKQKDFLMAFVRMFNLYFEVDKNNPNNYLIEPRDNFYDSGTVKDWTKKWAIDKPTTVKPLSELDAKTYKWQYKKDEDYYNKQYFESYQESYGSKKIVLDNEFEKKENVTEICFSATPIVDNTTNWMIIPKIFNFDGTTTKRMKHNIRLLYWLNDINGPSSFIYTIQGVFAGSSPRSSYFGTAMVYGDNAGLGLFGNVLAPTESIEFGLPNQLFYTTPSYTNNNLFTRYLSRFFLEIADRDSKLVTMWLKLDPQDISTFSFRNTVFIEDTYYLVNKIIDYNPINKDLTKVELLKLRTYSPDTGTSARLSEYTANKGGSIVVNPFGESERTTNYGGANNTLNGENLNTRSIGSYLSGKNISICESCYKVNVISSEEVWVGSNVSSTNVTNCSGVWIAQGVSGINLIGCENIEVQDDVFNYQGYGIKNRVITSVDSNSGRFGIPMTFEDGSTH